MTDPNQHAIGVEHNGQIWDGARWVPKPPSAAPGYGSGGRPGPPPSAFGYQGPVMGGPVDPRYGYLLTQRASDDIQFIARFTVVMIWIWIVAMILSVVVWVISLLAIGSFATHFPR
jgi:hypothetical protein